MSIPYYSGPMLAEYDTAVSQLAMRAEDLTDLDGTFVETIYLKEMQAPGHQIINGRRGSGKTHLLLRAESSLRHSFVEGGVLPIYINGLQLNDELSVGSSDPLTVALAIYIHVMQHVGREVRRFVGELNQVNFWDRIVGNRNSRHTRQAEDIVADLEETLIKGRIRLLPSGEVYNEATTVVDATKSSSVDASVKAYPKNLAWSVSAGVAAGKASKSSSVTTSKMHGERMLSFRDVSATLVSLLDLLGDASIHVLLDEWSEIGTDPEVQPYLADLLKRTTSNVPHMYFKLACIPGRTRLATPVTDENRHPIGMEEGDDLNAEVNLDKIVFAPESLDQVVPFFTRMIKKHVGEKVEWVRNSSFLDFESFLITKVFAGEAPLVELCHASGGVPRDFINIYKLVTAAAANAGGSDRQPFDLRAIRLGAQGAYDNKRASFGKIATPQLQLLDSIYKKIYVEKNAYRFLLSEEDAEDDRVQTLYMERLVHRLPGTYYYPRDERTYLYFQLDYGATIGRLMYNAANDARASYESSIWARLESFRGRFLGNTSDSDKTAFMAAYTALSDREPSKFDYEPHELIFRIADTTATRSGPRGRGRHRR